jgi:hypothetical protein
MSDKRNAIIIEERRPVNTDIKLDIKYRIIEIIRIRNGYLK